VKILIMPSFCAMTPDRIGLVPCLVASP